MKNIKIEDLSISFGSTDVIKKINLDISPGEFVVLLGPSGCGKSTLLNAIAGLTDVTSGKIHIDGCDVTYKDPSQRDIGMVFQSYALYPTMNVYGNLAFSLKMRKWPKNKIKETIYEVAEILQITDYLDRRPAELSGGQRQRVAIGRALVRDVGVFLFDEPLSNLDAKLRLELRIELKKLHQILGSTIIYVTHDQVEAMTLADKVVILHDKIIQQAATPKEIYQKPKNKFVAGFIGAPTMNFMDIQQQEGKNFKITGYEKTINLEHSLEKTDMQMQLGVRPEHFEICAKEDENALKLDVDIKEELGKEALIWGSIGENSAVVQVSEEEVENIDQQIYVKISEQKYHLFHKETGENLTI